MAANGHPEPGEISTKEACKRLECHRAQLHRHVLEGALSAPRREGPGLHCLVWYKASEVDKLAQKWHPVKRRRYKKKNLDVIATNERGRLAAKIISLFGKRTFSEICIECDADPAVVQQIYETLSLGLDGRIKMRREQERREQDLREERERMRDERTEKHRRYLLEKARLEGKKTG